MIISHKLKVIYIKLSKVAGTSFQIALSKYCGTDDIITPINAVLDEDLRQALKSYKAQNYMDHTTKKPRFYGHTTAQEIKQLVPAEVWDNYLKVAIIRCPYDMRLSSYYFTHTEEIDKETFEEYIAESADKDAFKQLFDLHIKGKIAADFLIRYEHLSEDIKELEAKLNCPGLLETFQSIKARSSHRHKIASKQYILNTQMRN